MFEISELKAKTIADLQVIAKSIGLKKTSQLKKIRSSLSNIRYSSF